MFRFQQRLFAAVGLALILGVPNLWLGCGGEEPAPQRYVLGDSSGAGAEANRDNEEWTPLISSVEIEPRAPRSGGSATARVELYGMELHEADLGYVWRVNGRIVRGGGPRLMLPKVKKGDDVSVTVTAVVDDAKSEPLQARTRVGNTPPIVEQVKLEPLGEVTVATNVTAKPVAFDNDGDELEYDYRWWVNGSERSETGATLSTQRLRRGDKVQLRVWVSDDEDRSRAFEVPMFEVGNAPPRVTSRADFRHDGEVFRYQIEAEDPDGDRSLRYRIDEGPPGIAVDNLFGMVTWDPPEGFTGTHAVVVMVEDRHGGKTKHAFSVTIGEETVPAAPTR